MGVEGCEVKGMKGARECSSSEGGRAVWLVQRCGIGREGGSAEDAHSVLQVEDSNADAGVINGRAVEWKRKKGDGCTASDCHYWHHTVIHLTGTSHTQSHPAAQDVPHRHPCRQQRPLQHPLQTLRLLLASTWTLPLCRSCSVEPGK